MPHTTETEFLEEEVSRLRRRVAELERRLQDDSDVAGGTTDQSPEQTARKFATLFETSPDAVMFADAERRITMNNPAVEEMFGYRDAELIGMTTEMLYADKQAFADQGKRRYRSGSDTNKRFYEVQYQRKDGSVFWTESHGSQIQDDAGNVIGFMGLFRDITDRKQAEEALKRAHDELERRVEARTAELAKANRTLNEEIEVRKRAEGAVRQSEEQFRELLENQPDGVVVSLDGICVLANSSMSELTGRAIDELIGKRMSQFLIPEDRERGRQRMAGLLQGAPQFASEYTFIRKDSTTVPVEILARRIVFAGKPALLGVTRDISERKQSEQAILQSEQRLRDILDGLFGFVGLYTTDGILIEVNRAPLEAAGLKKKDVIGQPFWETYWWSYSTKVQDQLKDALRRAARGETVRYDVPVRVADDRLIEIDVTFSPLFDYDGNISQLLGFAVDISERKQAEAALRKSEERLNLAVRGTSDGLWDTDLETGREYWSPRLKELLGYREDEIEATFDRFQELLHPEDKADVLEAIRLHLEEQRTYDIEFRLQAKSGEYRWFQSRGKALRDENGRPYRIAGSMRDITLQKQLQEQVHQHRTELAHVSRLNTMGEMATGLAHELNQPLAAISLYCTAGQSLADADSADLEPLQELFEKSAQQAVRAGEIIRRLRTLVAKRTSVRSTIDVVETVKDVLFLLEPDLRQSGICIEQQTDPPGCIALADEIQIQQVLVNLIRNALDAMSETESQQRTLKITILRKAGDLIEIAIRDTGEGVPPEKKDQVFDAFFTTKSEGMGMGLAISRTIIESHGGRLWMTANSDRGVTFYVTLPVAEEESDVDGS